MACRAGSGVVIFSLLQRFASPFASPPTFFQAREMFQRHMVARSDSPAKLAVALEQERILDRVLLLHTGGAAGFLEIIHAFSPHQCVLEATKINPNVR
jgi:hypothetical protein